MLEILRTGTSYAPTSTMTPKSAQHLGSHHTPSQDDIDMDRFLSSCGIRDPGFQLGAWGAEEDKNACDQETSHAETDEVEHESLSCGKRSVSQESHILTSDCGEALVFSFESASLQEDNCLSPRRVQFCECPVTEINYYPKPPSGDWSLLYYSAHELQKMLDERAAEKKTSD